MCRRFEGRVAVVTGSSRGIGRAIALRLAAEGADVVVNGRDARATAEVEAAVREAGGRATSVNVSVGDERAATELVATAIDHFGRLDMVVNNVGLSPYYGPLMDVDQKSFAKTMVGNTWPAVALVQEATRAGLGRGAAVLNVSTIGAHQVQPFAGPYTASKSALDVLTRVMARELGRSGVRVNGVAPGLVRTRTSSVVWEDEDRSAGEISLVPLGRLGEPEDVASAAAFLLSDEAAWITGTTLVVDGGRLLVGDEPFSQIGVFSGGEPATSVAQRGEQ